MNNNTMSRRPAGPVRQHSLQQPPRRHQQQIRRQRSSEDEKTLKIYSSTVSSRNRFASNNNNNNNSNKFDLYNQQELMHDHRQHHHHHRPKVRVAWDDQQQQSSSSSSKSKHNDTNVEIVARQITTTTTATTNGKTNMMSRPTTGRGIRRCPLAEKATFLYSRQELAERLRLAWRQREENKSNIDIFLAHSTVEERSESRLSTMTSVATPKIQVKNHENEVRIEDQCQVVEDKTDIDVYDVSNGLEYEDWFSNSESNESTINIPEDSTSDVVEDEENKENIETSSTGEQEEEEEEVTVIEKKSSISIHCNDWNTSITINNKSNANNEQSTRIVTPIIKEPDYTQAKLKRANFQSGLNKAFNTPISEKSSTPRISSRLSNHTQESTGRFRRTNSAPPQRRTQVNIVIDTPGMTTPTNEQHERPARIMSANNNETKNRPVKSAPTTKRRTKISKRRGLSMNYSKDGEDDNIDGKAKFGKNCKNGTMENKSGDVITMVSLISSADSESEMDDNSPRDDKLINELRSKLPTTPIIKSSNGLSAAMRKPFKSVSFQQDSFDYDSPPPSRDDTRAISSSSSSSLQARFVALSKAVVNSTSDDTSPLIVAMTSWNQKIDSVQCSPIITTTTATTIMSPFLQQQQETPTIEAPLTDREKRCLAVPIGDVLDKKRKLVRCRSAVVTTRDTNHEKHSSDTRQTCLQTEMRLSQIAKHITVNLQENVSSKTVINATVPAAEVNEEKPKHIPSEPYCQTPKEKECWHLYKKMCDKGVFVSFDTVLRGMLTPTEYRLRQKEVSQNC